MGGMAFCFGSRLPWKLAAIHYEEKTMSSLNCNICECQIKKGFLGTAKTVKGFDGDFCKPCASQIKKWDDGKEILTSLHEGLKTVRNEETEEFEEYFSKEYGEKLEKECICKGVYALDQTKTIINSILENMKYYNLRISPKEERILFFFCCDDGVETCVIGTDKKLHLNLNYNRDGSKVHNYEDINNFNIKNPDQIGMSSRGHSIKFEINGNNEGDIKVENKVDLNHLIKFMEFVVQRNAS